MLTFPMFARMRADHLRLLSALEALESEPDDLVRERALLELMRMLQRQFDTHMRAEEEVLFPALVQGLPLVEGILVPLRSQHRGLRALLAVLRRTLKQPASSGREEQIASGLRELGELLRTHVHHEEALVFGVAERVMPEPALLHVAELLEQRLNRAGLA
jgi:hemerythrin-like domain-containing protein